MDYLTTRLTSLAEKRARDFNTLESRRVDELFLRAVGLDKTTENWTWARTPASQACTKLDGWVKLRQEIAHGSGRAKPVRKDDVTRYQKHVQKLVDLTDATVNDYLLKITSIKLFQC